MMGVAVHPRDPQQVVGVSTQPALGTAPGVAGSGGYARARRCSRIGTRPNRPLRNAARFFFRVISSGRW